VVRFLSQAWFDALAESTRPLTGEGSPGITVQQVVTGTPDGDVRYAISLSDEGAAVRPGQAAVVDVTFTEDYATAAAVARGELTAQAALLAGRIRVAGNLAALMTRPDVVYDFVPPAVRAATWY
jgi:alkyl sulfatase BDS1-like metallo-beta-lactamase superfamily hydrolase